MLGYLKNAKQAAFSHLLHQVKVTRKSQTVDDLGDVTAVADGEVEYYQGHITVAADTANANRSVVGSQYRLRLQRDRCDCPPCIGDKIEITCGPYTGHCFRVSNDNGDKFSRSDSTGAFWFVDLVLV